MSQLLKQPSPTKTARHLLLSASIMTVVLVFAAQIPVGAMSAVERRKNAFQGIEFYDGPCSAVASGSEAPLEATPEQIENAQTIIGIAKKLRLGDKGALIGLMVGLAESNLRNLANDGTYTNEDGAQPYIGTQLGPISTALPHDGVGNDNDSVGIMQQRAIDGHWGPVDPAADLAGNIQWLMTPAYAAEAFFAMPTGKQDNKALVNVADWQNIDPEKVAQAVQVSAYNGVPNIYNHNSVVVGENYLDKKIDALQLLTSYYERTPDLELPVPLTVEFSAPTNTNIDYCAPGGSVAKILAKIFEYAWPNYCSSGSESCRGYSSPVTRKSEYIEAVNRAKDSDGYFGSPCFGGGVDCGGFVTIVMRESGADPNYNTYTNEPGCSNRGDITGCQLKYLLANSGPGGKYIQVPPAKLQPGDIAVKGGVGDVSGHTYFYVGKMTGPAGEAFNGATASASLCGRAPMAGPEDSRIEYEWFRLVR